MSERNFAWKALLRHLRSTSAARILLLYLLLAVLWLFFSERLILLLPAAPHTHSWLLAHRGTAFLAVTVFVFCAALREEFRARSQAEKKLFRLTRIHTLLATVNQSITRLRNREELFQEVCRLAVEEGLFQMAWVGLADQFGLRPAASWGLPEGHRQKLFVFAANTPGGWGPGGDTVQRGEHFLCNDIARDPRTLPWREEALRQGYRSLAVFPFRTGKKVVGALALYAAEPGFFDAEGICLLEQLAADVSLATEVMDQREHYRYAEEKVWQLANYDPLTGLPRRHFLEEALRRAVTRARREEKSVLFLMGVDNFKFINNTLGRAAGDHVLAKIAQSIEERLRPGDILSRLEGDEFGLLRADTTIEEALLAAEEMRRAVERARLEYNGYPLSLSLSIGLTHIDGSLDAQQALTQAEVALQRAKEEGKNRVVVSYPGENTVAKLAKTRQLVCQIKEAVRKGQFSLVYQPIVSLSSTEAKYHEAFVRLPNENGSHTLPGTFIPVAERFGLMPQVDRWVVQQAVSVLQSRPDVGLFVNLSGASLGDEELLRFVEETVRGSGVAPSRLGFEITETAVAKDLQRAGQWIARLKTLGCPFALDDFGVGFSSFAHLRTLPVDYLKIDGSFVRTLGAEPANRALIRAMNDAAHALGKLTIAEFVENEETLAMLRELQVDFAQGYHLGRPAPFPKESG
ncbi:MAG: EAL domain-containing protein [Bacillota bacterium]